MGQTLSSITIAALASATLTSGCSSLVSSVLEAPKVQFRSVQIRDTTNEGGTAVIELDVDNPNGVSLKVDQLDYAFEMGGRSIAKANVSDIASLKSHAVTRVEIPVPFRYSDVVAGVIDLMTKGTAVYKVNGVARIGIFTLPFEHSGDVKIRP